MKEWDIWLWASGLANTVWLAGRITDSALSWRWVYFPVTATSQQLCWKNRKWKINTDQGRPGIVRLKGRWLLYSLIEWRIEWSVLLWRLSISCVSTATPSGQFLWSFIERPPSLGGKSLKYRSRMTIINRSTHSYHFLLSLQLSMSIFVGCLVCLFLVWALFQPNKAGWRSGYKSRPVTEFIIKRKCHSAVCLRPSLRPDDREVALKIGKGNHNIADLIIVT